MTSKPADQRTVCCARCTKPIEGDRHKVGRFTYGDCCVLTVKPDYFKPEREQVAQ